MVALDDVVAFTGVLGSIGMCSYFAFMMIRKPEEMLANFGYVAADKEQLYPLVVSLMRYLGAAHIAFSLVATYLLVLSVFYTGLWQTSLTFVVVYVAGLACVAGYRAFYEDLKTPKNSAVSVEANKKNFKITGAALAVLLFAEFLLWLYSPAYGQNYVNDAVHGLPDNLTFVKNRVQNFFLQHRQVVL